MGSASASDEEVDWAKAIKSILKSSSLDAAAHNVKKLRKMVLLSLQMDDSDKAGKKAFKKQIQKLEEESYLKLDSDGQISVLKTDKEKKKKKKRKSEKEDKKKKKKRKKNDGESASEDDEKQEKEKNEDGADQSEAQDDNDDKKSADKNKPCKGNPSGVTRLFLGNLPFAVDEASLGAFFPGELTHIKWITDKETGKFYGSAFVEIDSSQSAADAVAMAGEKLMGRPIKINFAPARDGDVWPPEKKVVSGGGGGQAGGKGVKAMSAKPKNCMKLFIGNLSYDIDDEGITKFFGAVDAEIKAVRWLHHKDSGDFKGCGYVEFWNTEACEKGATLNGKNLLGRPIRIDWTD